MSRYTDVDLKNKRLPPVGGYWNERLVSLEEAAKPIESLFTDLKRSVKTAKKHCTFPSKHGLTHDESAAVYLYTMEGGERSFYRVLNEALRSDNRPALRPWFAFLKLFEEATKKLPTVKGNLWRGIVGNVSGQFTKDEVLTWWSVSSCSLSLSVIQGFLGSGDNSTLFLIEAVNGRDASSYSYYPNESEVILCLGTELRVKGDTLKHQGGLNIVHLLQLTDNDSDDEEQLPKAVAQLDIKPKVSSEKATGRY